MKTRHRQESKPLAARIHRKLKPHAGTPSGPKAKKVRFFLERPGARSVFVVGSFNGWDCQRTPLAADMEGGWKIDLLLEPGRYEYRFLVDGQWLSDPNARESVQNKFGSTNSVLIVD